MLDQVVRDQRILQRLRASALGDVLEDFVGDMQACGYADRTIGDYTREAGLLARWMADEGHTVKTLDESTVEKFLRRDRSASSGDIQPSERRKAPAAMRQLLSTLRTQKVIALSASATMSPVESLVHQFRQHSMHCRGLTVATCQQQSRYVQEFLAGQIGEDKEVDVTAISARDLIDFVTTRAVRGQTRAAQCAATALRAFLRFLALEGLCPANLSEAIPTVAHRTRRLRRHLSHNQLDRLLTSFDRRAPAGRRDYAMALCMARLGLRVGEVVGLRLDDIGWRKGTLRVVTGKSRRTSTLPLPEDVGRAIAQYVRRGRPATDDRHVFVTHVVPAGRVLETSAARTAIRRAFDRSGESVCSKGTHVLRHTVATTMVCQGVSLKEIADVLRHRSLDTTAVYARVDLPSLTAVALPWPEVRS